MDKRALVLFAHGARSASWAAPFERLRDLVQAQRPDVAVSLAFLELMEPRLPAHVHELAAAGVTHVTVVPVFLGQGGHVLRDLPMMADALRGELPHVTIEVVGAAGEDPVVLQALANYCSNAIGAVPPLKTS
jgi:sirohydrochlorin cobaltochelatase